MSKDEYEKLLDGYAKFSQTMFAKMKYVPRERVLAVLDHHFGPEDSWMMLRTVESSMGMAYRERETELDYDTKQLLEGWHSLLERHYGPELELRFKNL